MRILIDSLNAEYGAKQNGPSGTTINSFPWSKSAIGSSKTSYNGCKELTEDEAGRTAFALIGFLLQDRSLRSGPKERFSHLTPSSTPIPFQNSYNQKISTSICDFVLPKADLAVFS